MVVTSNVTGSSVSAASGLATSAPAADSATSAAPLVKLASRTHLTLVESVVAMVTRSSTVSGGRSGSGRMPGACCGATTSSGVEKMAPCGLRRIACACSRVATGTDSVVPIWSLLPGVSGMRAATLRNTSLVVNASPMEPRGSVGSPAGVSWRMTPEPSGASVPMISRTPL